MAELISASEIFYTQSEPKTQNRYIVYCDGVPSWIIKACDRPGFKQNAQSLDHINTRTFFKGKTIWDTVTLSIYDFIVPSGAQAVMEWERLHHESVTGRDGYMDFYKKDLVINILGPVGDIVEEWLLKGCFITEAKFGKGDWSNDGAAFQIDITVQPDWCILQF